MENHESSVTVADARLQAVQEPLWLLLAVAVPLWVNFWGQQPFELPKSVLVRTLVWLLAGLTLTRYLVSGRSPWHQWRSNPLSGPVSLLALVLVVTTATAVDWRLSLWGSYDRSQGALTLLSYLLLFFLAADHFRTLSRARHLLTALVVASVPLILFGLLQAAGWHPFGLSSDARSPVFATLGRANFLGAYLALLVPPTLALLLAAGHRRRQALWAALLGSQLLVIGLTLARAAWLGTAVSLALFAMLWWGPRLARTWWRLAWSGIGLLVLSGPLAVLWLGQSQAGSGAARLAIWQGTAKLIGQRPLLGYGVDALGLVFPGVYPPELVYYQGREFFVDRAHNLFLDWAVQAGLPGVLAYCLVLLVFVIVAGRALRVPQSAEKRALLVAVLAAVLGNTSNNLVSFDVTATSTASWLLMGVGIGLVGAPAQTSNAMAMGRQWRWALAGLLLVGSGTATWQLNGRPLLADISGRAARRHMQAGEWERAVAAAERAVARWPPEPGHHLLLAEAYWGQAVAIPAAAHVPLAQAERALQAARRLRPGDPAVWRETARFYTATARQFGSDTRALAGGAYRQALILAPNDSTLHIAWGRAYLEDGNPEAAAPLLRQAVRLDASNGDAYLYLAEAELALGRMEAARGAYGEAVRLLPELSETYEGWKR